MYIRKSEKNDRWEAGARFIELGKPALDRILDYIDYINKRIKQLKKQE
jgi:hypothetical protein